MKIEVDGELVTKDERIRDLEATVKELSEEQDRVYESNRMLEMEKSELLMKLRRKDRMIFLQREVIESYIEMSRLVNSE